MGSGWKEKAVKCIRCFYISAVDSVRERGTCFPDCTSESSKNTLLQNHEKTVRSTGIEWVGDHRDNGGRDGE